MHLSVSNSHCQPGGKKLNLANQDPMQGRVGITQTMPNCLDSNYVHQRPFNGRKEYLMNIVPSRGIQAHACTILF
jgi:hypothetical protein